MGVRQARAQMNGQVTEAEFQQTVVQYAVLRGWRTYHTHDSRRSNPGYPDLTLVRDRRIVFAELKTETGRVTHDQQEWLTDLLVAANWNPGVDVYVWHPSDWGLIEDVLR